MAPQHSRIQTEVLNAITNVYERNWFVLGSELETFEKQFALFSNASHCVGVGNGLDALFIALKACGIGTGDEVIVPAHTFLATWLAVTRTGATIIPVDADSRTLNIDAKGVEAAITQKTKALIPVHLYGQPCDMTALSRLATHRGIFIVEDNAQAHGATWNGKVTGSFGDLSATSFYPVKNLGALGDGGAIVTSNEDFAEFVRRYRNYGFLTKNVAEDQGVNSRLDEIQAAVLSVKLKHIQAWNDERIRLAASYITHLDGIGDIQLPVTHADARHVFHLFVILTSRRDALREYLAAHHIETAIHYPIPPHLQKSYASLGYQKGDYPIAEQIASNALSLPLWPGMEESQVAYVCEVVRKFFR